MTLVAAFIRCRTGGLCALVAILGYVRGFDRHPCVPRGQRQEALFNSRRLVIQRFGLWLLRNHLIVALSLGCRLRSGRFDGLPATRS